MVLQPVVHSLLGPARLRVVEDVLDDPGSVYELLGKVIGHDHHIVAKFLYSRMNETVGTRACRHAECTRLEVRCEDNPLGMVVHGCREQAQVSAGVHVHDVQDQVRTGPVACSVHGLAQVRDVPPVSEILPKILCSLLDEVHSSALALMVIRLEPVNFCCCNQSESLAAQLHPNIPIQMQYLALLSAALLNFLRISDQKLLCSTLTSQATSLVKMRSCV